VNPDCGSDDIDSSPNEHEMRWLIGTITLLDSDNGIITTLSLN
jgi:hypothetical protein